MDAHFRNDTVRKMDEQKIEAFCARNTSRLVRADPEEVIRLWLDWYYARYQVDEQDDGFYITDMDEKEVVAFVSKKTPRAFVHAYELFESLNEEIEDPFLSIDGRPMIIPQPNLISCILEGMKEESKNG